MSFDAQLEDAYVTPGARRAAAAVDAAGKHEPALRERGIPADVLERLLPGDDVLVLEEPEVAGGLGYRFVKRAFDVCACGLALALLALPMAAMAVKVKSESPGPVIYAQERDEQVIIRHSFGSCSLNTLKAQLGNGNKLVSRKPKCAFGRKGRGFVVPTTSAAAFV
ncbi:MULTISPECIES: sugar transferase [unclassified Adlercreutzia]|uniref:sugar transferase n=1 Tax=unclassified Adlercreutzia TaxID=2636013 RepID=UPI00197E7EED|nr:MULTISPECIES: sugar transferase [unclassified Adlercreutzia]